MRVLVTGRAIPTQPDRCTGQQLAVGFQQAGHECVFYGQFYNEPYRFLGAKEAQEMDFDLVVVTEMNDGMPGYESLFNHHKLKNVPRLYWDFDVSYHPDVSYGWATRINYDGYLVGNKHYVGLDAFGRFGKPTLHLPYACSPQIHRRIEGVEKSYILGFIGSMTEERKRLIELAKSGVGRVGCIHAAEGVYGDDLVRQTNQYYVMFHNNQDACKGLVPGRPWEATGCGAALLMDRSSYQDFVEFLPSNLHDNIFVYNNDTDILAWLQEYAMWGKKEASLDIAGDMLMRYMHANHSYKNRAEAIIEWTKQEKIM